MGETKSTKNRREKGAITLFILIAMFFFLIVLYSLYANNVSRLSAQRNYVADIQKQYEETIDEEKIKEEYDKITSEKIRIVLYIASTGKIYSTDQWTNQNLKMEIDFPESVPEGERYFFIDGEKKKYDGEYIIENNCKIETSYKNMSAEVTISRIDKILPTVALSPNGGTGHLIPATGKATIETKLTAEDKGGSGLDTLEYAWTTSDKEEPTTWIPFNNEETVSKTDCTEESYYLWTKVTDKAGNRANVVKISKQFIIEKTKITGNVKIAGTNQYGETLTAETTVNPSDATLTYQWYSNTNNATTGGTAIDGATGKTYKVGSGLVGKYIYVVVTAKKENYADATFSDITDVTTNESETVEKANLSKPTVTGTYTYNGASQTVSLNGYNSETMNVSGNTGTDAGDYTATISLKDSSNYQWSDGSTGNVTLSWKINAKSVAVTWGETTSFVYNGSAQAPTASATSGVNGETINVTRTTGTNVGSYTSTASIASVTGGRGKASNYTLTGTTKAFTITNATITGSVKVTGTNRYGSTLTAETTVNPDDATLTYQWYSNTNNTTTGGTAIEEATGRTYTVGSGLVGKYIYVVVTAKKANYTDATFNDITDNSTNGSETVTKANLSKPTVAGTYTYNGGSQTVSLSGYNSETMNVSGNTGIDAGDYTATISLKDSNNYQWSDGSTGNVTLSWKINAKSVAVTWGETTSFVYNGTAQAPTASADSGIDGETINVTRTAEKNIGNYTSTASIASVTGGRGKASNYTLTGNTKDYSIVDAGIIGSVKITGTNQYGETLTAETAVDPDDATLTYQWYSNTNNTTTGGTVIENATGKTYTVGSGLVGKYIYVVVTAKKANYADTTFSDITDSTTNGSGTVSKISLTKPTVTGTYTYNGASQTVSLSGYSSSTMNVSGNTGTDAGDYTATVSLKDSSNYQWSDGSTGNVTLSWKINPKSVAVTWGTTTSFVYNGSAQAPTASATSGVNGETINVTRTTGTNVGSYTSTASISSVTGGRAKASNYTLTGTTKAFTITNATITGSVKVTGTNRYGSTLTAETTVNPDDATLTYQWYSNTNNATTGGTAINGAEQEEHIQ